MGTDFRGQLTDQVIERSVGPYAVHAAAGYVEDCVHELTFDSGGLISASVQGTQLRPYRVVVTPLPVAPHWSGRCTCPVGVRCKHIAAVLLAARRTIGAAAPAPASWEEPLTALVRSRAATPPRAVPLALQFEVIEPRPPVYGDRRWRPPAPQQQRVRLRPVLRGRSGKWVRTGVSWRDLQSNYGFTTHDLTHREVLRAFCATYVAAGHSYYGYGADLSIHLDELGPALWRLLSQADEAGLELVPAKASSGGVAVLGPAELSLDLRQARAGGGAVMVPVVTVGGHTVNTSSVELIGSRIHGLFVTDPSCLAGIVGPEPDPGSARPGLVLAPLAQPPDEHLASLLRAGDELAIPAEDLSRFLAVYYPVLRQAVSVTSSDASVKLPEITAPRLAATVTFRSNHEAILEWAFAYQVGDNVEQVPLDAEAELGRPGGPRWDAGSTSTATHNGDTKAGAGTSSAVARDHVAERRLVAGLDPTLRGLLASRRQLTGMDAISFTEDVLPALHDRDDVLLSVVGEQPTYRHVDVAPVIRLSATDVADDSDWFDLGVAVSIADEDIPFDELFTALATDCTHLMLASGTYFSLQRPELEQLRRLIEEARSLQDRESTGLRLSVYQVGMWEELRELGVIDTQSRRWAGAVQGLLEVDDLAPPELPTDFDAVLRPYQLDGYQWLTFLWQHGLGGILADDMGLGKTIQTLAMICHAREAGEMAGPFLVVAPTSVVANWAQEARRFAPGLKVCTVTETIGRRDTPLAEDIAGADLVVTSYALFRIDFDAYRELSWAGLILDEAQFVKNHQAKTYQYARLLPAPFKLAITGTPLENSLMDLWSLLSIVAPGLFPSPQRFSDHYRRPIERGSDPELLSTLRRRIRPLLRRRTKAEVAAELPPKQEQVLEVQLNPRHQKIYQTHLQRERQKVLGLLNDLDKNRFAIFRSLTLLRQLSLDPALVDPAYADVRSSKADAFLDQLREVVSEGHRALVFSQFTGFLGTVRARLDAEGIAYCYLDGRTRNRPALIDSFKHGDAPVFLISLKAGGVGLNLTEADYCFILDPWWNPATEAQAVDRTHRIGQDKTVMVYRLVATGTIEEKVMELKARKQSLFDRVLDDDALLSAPLSVEDIKGLFS